MPTRKKIGSFDYTPLVVLAAIGVAGYFAYQGIFGGEGSQANADNNNDVTAGTTSSLDSSIATSEASGMPQSASDAQLSGYANTIWRLGQKVSGKADPETAEQIIEIMSEINNATDLYIMMRYFGVKQVATGYFTACYIVGKNCQSYDFPSYLRGILDSDSLYTVNKYLDGNGISYQF